MIDIHSHILPIIDDGAKNVRESMAMLVDSYSQGVRVCVATPHVMLRGESDIYPFLMRRKQSAESLLSVIPKYEGRVPKIIYGAEVFLDKDISVYNDLEKLCMANTRCLLIELSFVHYDEMYAEWLYSLTMKGITPIIAHVERYPYHPRLIEDIKDIDVVYQVNSRTLLRGIGRRFAAELADSGSRVVAASDMHNTGLRSCCVEKAYKRTAKFSKDLATEIFETNPLQLFRQ